VITRIGFYIEVEVRGSLILSIAITTLKVGDILTYSPVPFILCMVYRLISRSAAYKALFALIAVVRGAVSSVGIE
jgi:hypothetical protein